jgi:hypothetical protein
MKTTDSHKSNNTRDYAFCEAITASGSSPWHIRKLTKNGLYLGGGTDTPALCGRVVCFDLAVPVTIQRNYSICKKCLGDYLKESNVPQVKQHRPIDREFVKRLDRMDAEILLAAIMQIRDICYNHQAAGLADSVLDCIRVAEAEAAIFEIGVSKKRKSKPDQQTPTT